MSPDRSDRPLLIASNRGPVSFRQGSHGDLVARRGGGGLVTALGALADDHNVTWIAHAMTEGDVLAARNHAGLPFEEVSRQGAKYHLKMVGTLDAAYDLHYNVLANPLLWFAMHRMWGFGSGPVIDRRTHAAWQAYRDINRRIANAIVEEIDRSDQPPIVMVHDYHLFLVPQFVRAARPDAAIEFFLHVPWPATDAWQCLPQVWVGEIVESLCACDVVGVQTPKDAKRLRGTCHDRLGASIDELASAVRHGDRTTLVRAYPISVSVDEFTDLVVSSEVRRLRKRVAKVRPADGSLIVRVDRSDPSKNILRGIDAYALLLHEHPELHGRVAMFCQLDPSRQSIAEYRNYLDTIHAKVAEFDARFGSGSWRPLVVNEDSSFLAAVAAYLEYDVLYVNPVADGMNLVSKEGPLINERDGVVVLSERAGSYNELAPHVIGINPFDVAGQADALATAINMDAERRSVRANALREQVRTHGLDRWIATQVEDITGAANRVR
jgi:trehalose 6-phosphate synthase